MTNAQSKYLLCTENFPIPEVSDKLMQELITDYELGKRIKKNRGSKSSWNHYVVQFNVQKWQYQLLVIPH